MKPIWKGAHERCEIRRSTVDRPCWTWAERNGSPERQCTRVIGVGELYLVSTIYPGHDSGWADGGQKRTMAWTKDRKVVWVWEPIEPHPISSHFCMPCVDRWTNLREAKEWIEANR